MKNFLAAAVLLLLTGCGMFEKYEEPAYRVVKKDDAIEWRAYEPFLMAEVTTTGARDAAANDGFRLLADYIFGGNEPQEKMAMTIPVTQQKQHDGWTVQFVMPLSRTLADLPKPTNSHVRLFQQPAKNMLAIRFSGTSAQSNLDGHEKTLRDYAAAQNIALLSEPIYAFYNSPFTLPFMRRNEILFEVAAP